MINQLIEKKDQLKHNAIQLFVGMICTIKIVYGWDIIVDEPGYVVLNALVVLIVGCIFQYFIDKLSKVNSNKTLHINNIFKQKELYNELHNEYQQIFESLEEGIVVVKNDKLSFTNEMFHQIFKNDASFSQEATNS